VTWYFDGKPVTEDMIDGYVGFCYIITNNVNGKKYIGKKLFTAARTRAPLKGRKRKRRTRVPSDWMIYYGSNKELCEDVKRHGPEHFHREILRLCSSKSEASYHEAKFQFEMDAIISDNFYNQWISVKIHRNSTLDKRS
jgi:hypothetical protein